MREDRLFNQNGRRHFRRRYSRREVQIGGVILLCLAAIAAWIGYRGAHPDPALFEATAALLREPQQAGDRGPLPEGLAADGFSEASVRSYNSDNLYEKIDGREGYFKAFGFEMLYTASLLAIDESGSSVDIELYDLAKPANALGAYAGERSEDAASTFADGGLKHATRNALFATRGRFYLRAIGSSGDAKVKSQLDQIEKTLLPALPADSPPWAFALFAGQLGANPSEISFLADNALGFGFAKDLWVAVKGEEETELFVAARASEEEARQFAAKLLDGFASYGEKIKHDGVPFVRDRYIQTLATAKAHGVFVIGVRGASDGESAEGYLDALRRGLDDLPEEVRAQAASSGEQPSGAVEEY